LSLAACASAAPKPEAANKDRLAEMFAETYRRIEAVHVEPVDAGELALGGLRHLVEADPTVPRDSYLAQQNGAAQAGPQDYDAWGAMTSESIVALVQHSAALQAMESQEVYDHFMTGIAAQLAAPSEFFPGDSVFTVLQAGITRKFDMGYDLVPDGVRIARLDPKGELEAQGLRLGDVITHIEGTAIAGLPKVRVFELLGSGLVFGGTELTLRRAGESQPIVLDVWEASGAKHHLRVRENEGIAEYRFVYVDRDSTRYLGESLSRRPGEPFRRLTAGKVFMASGILLDLRNTPDHPDLPVFTDTAAAVRLAGFFLSDAPIGSARSRHEASEEEWHSGRHLVSEGYPLVIVVDSTTSGAAEIAAAALQDAGRALVVGSTTAGEGRLHSLTGAATGGTVVTPSAYVYAPAGYPIEGRGVVPNICTSQPGATLESILASLHRGDGTIPEPERTRTLEPNDAAAVDRLRQLCPASADTDDLAYSLGLAILGQPALYERLLQAEWKS
jgi:carboxyl-terminal processing protease